MKRASLLIGLMVALLALTAGLAVAGGTDRDCTTNPRPECPGTNGDDDFIGEDTPDGDASARDFITGGPGDDGGEGNAADDVLLGQGGVDGEIDDFEGGENGDYVDGGQRADDEIEGNEGEDIVLGGPGGDFEVNGEDGPDVVRGGNGDDGRGDSSESGVFGGTGDNLVHGNDGADFIVADESDPGDRERIFGDKGNDDIVADDGQVDIINCGRGADDTVFFDPGIDELNGCENRNPVT